MKEEDLIKKLENVELPDIMLQSHQRRLKMALLDAGYLKRQHEDAIWGLVKLKIKGVKDMIIEGLVSQQPVWKTAIVGIVAMAIILGLSLTMPFTAESVYAQAEEIVQNSPEIKAALGGGEVRLVKIDIADNTGTVIAQSEEGFVSAKLDIKANKVTEVASFVFDDEVAIDIAKSDPRIRELLNSGATIDEDVSTMCLSASMGNIATGETENFVEIYVILKMKDNDNLYVARIDLAEGKVVSLTETPLEAISMEPSFGEGEAFSIPDPEFQYSSSEQTTQ